MSLVDNRRSAPGATKRRFPVGAFVSAVPDLTFSALYLIIWIDPIFLIQISTLFPGPEIVGLLIMLMFLECLVIQIDGLLNKVAFSRVSFRLKVFGTGMILLLVTPYLWAMCAAVKALWPLWQTLLLGANKFVSGLNEANRSEAATNSFRRWAAMLAVYFPCILFAFVLPIPALGVEPWMADIAGFEMSGEMVDSPQRILAAGFVYFLALGIVEFRQSCRN